MIARGCRGETRTATHGLHAKLSTTAPPRVLLLKYSSGTDLGFAAVGGWKSWSVKVGEGKGREGAVPPSLVNIFLKHEFKMTRFVAVLAERFKHDSLL